ncbi:MAG: hypothetical protein WCU00_05570, partial [Candidatus Latescibacterota bacterium]
MKRFLCILSIPVFLCLAYGLQAKTALEPCTYHEDFETRELHAWAAYPHWEDTAYNENFRVNSMVPGDPNISIEHKITPYTQVDNYVGAQKLLDMYLTSSSTLSFRYYLKTYQNVEYIKVRFAAGTDGKIDFTIFNPPSNRWVWTTISFSDIIHENPALAGSGMVKVNALAFVAKIAKADPAMPIYLGIDDITFKGSRAVQFQFSEPQVYKLSEWKPYIPKKHYRQGEMFTLNGQWPADADQVELTITPFAERTSVLYSGFLGRNGDLWFIKPTRLDFKPGLYLAALHALSKGEVVSDTEFTLFIDPLIAAGTHPRLWFDSANKNAIEEKLRSDRFKNVANSISSTAKQRRSDWPVEKIVYDIDQYPEEDWLPTIDGWFDRIGVWRQGIYYNTLAYTFFGEKEAGEYAKNLLVKICAFPYWVHPWFTKRGSHIYYPLGEAGSEFAIGYDCLYGLMTPEERKIVREGLFKNIILGCHRGYVENNLVTNDTSNWVANIASGSLMCQAAIFGDSRDKEAVEPYLTGALFKEYSLIQHGFGNDGGYGEPNGYYAFTMDGLSEALPAMENVFGIDFSQKINGSYTELVWAGMVKKKYTFYYGKSGGELRPLTNWAWLLPKYKDPLLGWFYNFMKSGETLQDALYDTETVPRQDPYAENPVRVFRDIGTTVFKSGWEPDDFVFVMRSGPFYNHQFMDQGSFWLSDRGSLFIERRHGSTEPYLGATLYEPWYIQPVSHSTILLDMNHQSQRTGDAHNFAGGFEDYASIGHFLDGSRASFSSADIGRLYWGKVNSMQRNVLYLKPRTLLMLDTVQPADRDVDVNLLYQTLRLQDIAAGTKESTITKGGNTLFIEHLAPEQIEAKSVETPHYLYTLLGQNPLTKEGMLTVSARTAGNPLVIANLLTSTKGEKPDVTTEKGNGFVTGKAGGVTFAFTTRPGFSYETGGITTDALAVTWDDTSIFAAMATNITRNGSLLLLSSEPVTCEIS